MSFKRLSVHTILWRGAYFLAAFLLNILFARYYQASGSSPVYYLINLYSFILLIAGFSMESGISFFLAGNQREEGALAGFSLLWTVIVSVLSLLLLKLYFHFFDADIGSGPFGTTAAVYIPGQLLITLFTPLFYARDSPVLPNILLLATNMLLILVLLYARARPSAIDHAGFLRIYFFGFLTQGLTLAAAFIFQQGYQLSLPDLPLLKKVVRYSLVAFTANVAFFAVYRIDYWFVKRYCTVAELGNYIQAARLGQMMLVLPGILAGLIFSQTTLEGTGPMPARLVRMIRMIIPVFVFLFILFFFIGRPVIPFILGDSFDKMYEPMLLLLPGILFLSILTPLSAWFGGMHEPAVNARSALAGLVIVIAGDLLFIPGYKITGAAAVSSAGYFVCMLYSLLAFIRKNRIRPGAMLVVKREDWRWLIQQIGQTKR